MCTPSVWKCNQLLLVQWSTHLASLESFGPISLGVALFINSSVLFHTAQSVVETSADFSRDGREHPYKYFITMNLGSEMHCYGSVL